MSTLKVASINHPSASSGGLAIAADGNVTGAGLDLIVSQSFTAVSSVSVDDCFTSAYDNYRIIGCLSGSAAAEIRFRVRASGVDLATSYWYDSINGAAQSNVAFAFLSYCSNASSFADFDYGVRMPAVGQHTRLSGLGFRADGFADAVNAYVGNSNPYDGFTVYPQSGTITGTVRVYGYRN